MGNKRLLNPRKKAILVIGKKRVGKSTTSLFISGNSLLVIEKDNGTNGFQTADAYFDINDEN